MESISKTSLTLELKAFASKDACKPPNKENIKNMFQLLDVGKSGQVDIELLKYGLISIGSDKFSSFETEDFFKLLEINTAETKTVPIDQVINKITDLLSIFN
ncbi:EF-hand domain containing protein [Cryptosporidium felis]|nr:EF-hand domain containing protein [Cryptosporidium felis]